MNAIRIEEELLLCEICDNRGLSFSRRKIQGGSVGACPFVLKLEREWRVWILIDGMEIGRALQWVGLHCLIGMNQVLLPLAYNHQRMDLEPFPPSIPTQKSTAMHDANSS